MLRIFVIRDEVAKIYNNPFYAPNRAAAHRSFGDAIADEKSYVHAHPADYLLYELGSFDPVTADIKLSKVPELVARGADFVNPTPVTA